MISIGAASEPERISSARSVVSCREVAGDLELVAEFALDARDRDRLALAFLIEDDRHQLADVRA
jgi:hypothetical protein